MCEIEKNAHRCTSFSTLKTLREKRKLTQLGHRIGWFTGRQILLDSFLTQPTKSLKDLSTSQLPYHSSEGFWAGPRGRRIGTGELWPFLDIISQSIEHFWHVRGFIEAQQQYYLLQELRRKRGRPFYGTLLLFFSRGILRLAVTPVRHKTQCENFCLFLVILLSIWLL